MSHRGRVVSPEIGPPPRYELRVLTVLLFLVLLGAAVGVSFFTGARREREASLPLVDQMATIVEERDALSKEVAELKQQMIVLERSQQIDREAHKKVAGQLKKVQDERLAAEQEVSFLRRLIQEGGGGMLEPTDFKLEQKDDSAKFGYSFTVRQLIPEFGESTGSVDLKIAGKRNDKDVTLTLDELKGSEPKSHKMAFKYFQGFQGFIQVPDDFLPERVVVEIEPTTAKLIPVSVTFPWTIE